MPLCILCCGSTSRLLDSLVHAAVATAMRLVQHVLCSQALHTIMDLTTPRSLNSVNLLPSIHSGCATAALSARGVLLIAAFLCADSRASAAQARASRTQRQPQVCMQLCTRPSKPCANCSKCLQLFCGLYKCQTYAV